MKSKRKLKKELEQVRAEYEGYRAGVSPFKSEYKADDVDFETVLIRTLGEMAGEEDFEYTEKVLEKLIRENVSTDSYLAQNMKEPLASGAM